jgi:transcriptional regulator with XRE-family HTH domain
MVELEFENSSIRQRIEGQLTKNNLSRASLSQLTGLSDSTINNIFSAGKHSYRLEDNNNSNIKISPQALTKIANVLNTTFNYLAYGEISKTFFKDNNGIEYVSVYEYENFIEDISSNKSSLAKFSNGETRAYQKKYLDSFGGNYEDYFLIRNRLQGSVMSTVLPGDLLLIKKNRIPLQRISDQELFAYLVQINAVY